MPERRSLFIGRSGELAVLSEFLSRGYNAATPEIDVGEDIFVIEDGQDGYWPVQVKTVTALEHADGSCTAQFSFRRDQLVTTPTVELTYLLTLRRRRKWDSFLVIPRIEFYDLYARGMLGKQESEILTWTFDQVKVICQNADLTRFEGDWDREWAGKFE